MKKLLIFCFLFMAIFLVAWAGQASRIELIDGSVVNAEIVSFKNGFYTLKAPALGEFTIGASKIRKIEAVPGATQEENVVDKSSVPESSQLNTKNMNYQLEDLKGRIVNDADSMKIINNLADDPQIQDILKDPEITNAVKAGDIKTLMSNEKFMGLVNNPKIREIGERMKQQ